MVEYVKLSKTTSYSDERIDIVSVNLDDFVTTDNLLQNKLGLTKAVNLPPQEGQINTYKAENILVANIRPYLKKIWFADRNGGCSADILVFKVKENFDSKFVYYCLLKDDFFSHMMKGSKGTKMPRGDKGHIMDFIIPEFPKSNQQKIAKVLSSLDAKIAINNKINTELEAIAKLIYDYWFVQFDFPDQNCNPYKSSGGKMVFSEELKRDIPDGWEVKELGKFESNIITGKTPSTEIPENFNGNIPFICIGDVRDNMNITSTEKTLSEFGANSQSNKYIPKDAICVTCIASPGLVGFASEKSQTNQQLNSIVCKRNENIYYLYFYLKNYFKFAKAKTGNTFANMNKGDFSSIKVISPNSDVLLKFSQLLKPSKKNIFANSKQNQKLLKFRDWLLPMLMNCQVTVK